MAWVKFPYMRTLESRMAFGRFVRINRWGVHLIQTMPCFQIQTYEHVKWDWMDWRQMVPLACEEKQRLEQHFEAGLVAQYQPGTELPAFVQVWTMSANDTCMTWLPKPLPLHIDGSYVCDIKCFLPGKHLLYERTRQSGWHFVKPLLCKAEFQTYAPGGFDFNGGKSGVEQERYFAPGKCTRIYILPNYEILTSSSSNDHSTVEDPLVY